jgi:hypothetical protein
MYQRRVIGRDMQGANKNGPSELQKDQALQPGWILLNGIEPAILTPPHI